MRPSLKAATEALDWLKDEQLLDEPGDWRVDRPHLKGGGWAFQFANDYYPDLDDTAVVAWAMHQAPNAADYTENVSRALDWLVGMQSKNGGFAAFDADNTSYYLNKIPFADHGALLDPPTSDVSARVVTVLGLIGRPQDGRRSSARSPICAPSRKRTARGSDAGARTTSTAPGRCSRRSRRRGCPADDPAVRRAVDWLLARQNSDGGWGETNDSYLKGGRARRVASTPVSHGVGAAGLAGGGGSALGCGAPRR